MRIQPSLSQLSIVAGRSLAKLTSAVANVHFWAIAAGMALTFHSANAQGPMPGQATLYQPPYSTNDPSVIYPPGTPQTFAPWPQISPYQSANVAVDQYRNSDGIWFREILHRRRDYFASLEATAIWYRDAGAATVGSPFAPIYIDGLPTGQFMQPWNSGFQTANTFSSPGRFSVDPRVFPYPAVDSNANIIVFLENNDPNTFPIRSAANLPDPNGQAGLQLKWGFENEDGSGFMITGWFGDEANPIFRRGYETINGVPVTQDLTADLGGANLNVRYGNVPLDNGEPFVGGSDFGSGGTQKFDTYYELRHYTQAAGTNFSVYSTPIFRSEAVRVRPLWGLRYLNIQEGFKFRGIDSGFTYDYDGASGDGTYGPDSPLTEYTDDQWEATLRNDVESHIAGPEIGFRVDLGSGGHDGFRIWGETIFGLNANFEQIEMAGDNIGDALTDGRFVNIGAPRMLDPANQSEFKDKETTTHISPLFQQSIFVDFQFMRELPVLRRISLLEDTTFRLGYTYLWVGGVARPADSINWKGYPLYPSIKQGRENWWAQQFSAAIDWTY